MALTARQQRFVEAYIVDRNAARAARTAGYSANGAKVTACRLLTNPNLKAALAAKEAELSKSLNLTKVRVVNELLATIEESRIQAKPGEMIRGWVEIARITGMYNSEPVPTEVSPEGERLLAKFQALSVEELLEIAAGNRPSVLP